MADIFDIDYLKYQKEFLETGGNVNYDGFLNEIQFHDSYSPDIKNAIKYLFLSTTNFNTINLCLLMHEIQNADTNEEVKNTINSIYTSNNNVLKENDTNLSDHMYYSRENEELVSSFPPQVLKFFKTLLEDPQKMTGFDVIAILGIIWDTRISIKLNEYIENLIDLSDLKTESDMKRLFGNKYSYNKSLFKEYIRGI
ncbi:hypothetical protein [Staphylococcus gallinarum]|uniref:hypothetical protein n=1 Tax=Staphylococcus gallinarum TaxID=1293 RepID=UPI002DBC096F|nr:hypothetical protein [Staphylococcus gallinarum]MEB6279077.1 hypothetical protein [Staphylococcus gallinarum]